MGKTIDDLTNQLLQDIDASLENKQAPGAVVPGAAPQNPGVPAPAVELPAQAAPVQVTPFGGSGMPERQSDGVEAELRQTADSFENTPQPMAEKERDAPPEAHTRGNVTAEASGRGAGGDVPVAHRVQAAPSAPGADGRRPPDGGPPVKKKRRGLRAFLLAATAVITALAVAVVLFIYMPTWYEEESTISRTFTAGSVPIISAPVALETVEPENVPEETGPPELAFTAEETAYMDAMLDDWADQPTEWAVDESEAEPAIQPEGLGHAVSVYFLDLESGLTYSYNPDAPFHIASLNKAPYALYLYELAEAGLCDLNETFTVTPGLIASLGIDDNSGRIKDMQDLPRDFTMEELIYEMIRYSDTAALKILLQRYGAQGFKEYAEQLGIEHVDELRSLTNARITSPDAGVFMRAIYTYTENGAHGDALREHLLNARNPMISSAYPVAHKYGWDEAALHDMAVVYAPHPYVLVILTDKSAGSWPEQAMFGTIAAELEAMVAQKWQDA